MEAWKVAQLSYCWKIGMEDRLTSGKIGSCQHRIHQGGFTKKSSICSKLCDLLDDNTKTHRKIVLDRLFMPQEADVIQKHSVKYSTFWLQYLLGGCKNWRFFSSGCIWFVGPRGNVRFRRGSNNHSSTIMWQALWKAQDPNKIKVFHGILFGLSRQQSLIYFPNASSLSVTCEQCNEVPETSLHALWSCPDTKKVWQLVERINFILYQKNTFSLKLFPTLSWQLWLHRNGEIWGTRNTANHFGIYR